MKVGMTDDEVAARCHANCIETAREGARMAGSAGEIFEREGVVLFATGCDFPVVANGAVRPDPTVPANALYPWKEYAHGYAAPMSLRSAWARPRLREAAIDPSSR